MTENILSQEELLQKLNSERQEFETFKSLIKGTIDNANHEVGKDFKERINFFADKANALQAEATKFEIENRTLEKELKSQQAIWTAEKKALETEKDLLALKVQNYEQVFERQNYELTQLKNIKNDYFAKISSLEAQKAALEKEVAQADAFFSKEGYDKPTRVKDYSHIEKAEMTPEQWTEAYELRQVSRAEYNEYLGGLNALK